MRQHMPPKHRAFLETLDEGGPLLRTLVVAHHEAKGTGGTDLATFLKKTREETRDKLLGND